ncbi:MAG: S-layer homology domain-containing protein [Clostridia bacterium]|nr:S-layer homology domain-containing protein [Clostridia bacterium]
MKKRLLSLVLAVAMICALLPAAAFAGQEDTVYLSASYDGEYLPGLAYAAVSLSELQSIDLADYGLSDFDTGEITALHLTIYAHTVCLDKDWDDVRVSGYPGAIFFEGGLFGFADCNMNYYVNGEYPAIDGWGVTMDQCTLSPGDFIDFAAYSSWSFFYDSAAGFHYFMDGDQITHNYEIEEGEKLTVKLGRTSGGLGGETLLNAEADYPIFCGKTLFAEDAETATTNGNGETEFSFNGAGTYYLWADGAYGNEDFMSVVSSPAYAEVTVEAAPCTHETWNDATCTTPKTCADCGATEGKADPEAHSYVEGTCEHCGAAEPVVIPSYIVTLPSGSGYTVTAAEGSTSPVTEGGSYRFTVTIADGYEDGADFAVKANDVVLTAVDGVYTIENITADQTIAVVGVVEKTQEPAPTWREVMALTRDYLTGQAEEQTLGVGSTKGEWQVLGLARDGVEGDFYVAYYEIAKAYIEENADANGRLHASKSTDNSRLILALTAVGKDVTDIAGCDLIAGLSDLNYVKSQGINGAVFALIALDSYGYDTAETATATREALIDYILGKELSGGGWALSGQIPDDMTPMAVQALAPYYDTDTAVKTAVDKALTVTDVMVETASPETCAQIIVAHGALGQDSSDAMTRMLTFALKDGSFEKAPGTGVNQMSTEQAFYAMVAYDRYLSGENALYDMTDVELEQVQPEQPTTAETVKAAMEALKVEKADKNTYTAMQAILEDYAKLTREEKALISDAYEAFLDKEEDFEDLLKDAIDDAKLDLEDLYEELDSADYTEENWDEIRALYRDIRDRMKKVRYTEELEALLETFEEEVDCILVGAMEVTFRLIGDFKHDSGVSDHEGYVTWIKTTEYTLPAESTVYDLLMEALEEYDLNQKGASKNYVESIQAPAILGGYWLGEFDNGPNSGWMYTINGDHPGTGLKDHELEDGDEVIWHYVDDYTLEQRKPSSKYYEHWLEADDITPETYVKRNLDSIVTIEGKGEVKPELKNSHIGKDVKFTFTPAESWVIQSVSVDGKDKGAIETYTYKKLAMDARIEVIFEQAAEVAEPLNFTDVQPGDWFYDDVCFAVSNGLFNGVDAQIFAPNASMTRAMLVTVLYRLEGQPAVAGSSTFADVAAGAWYTDAVIWATHNGIVNGVGNGRFGTNYNVTREQIAAILYRYAQTCGYDTAARANLSGYTDGASIGNYAKDAMAWVNAVGLINGRAAATLAPTGTATRAEVAAMLHRFAETVAK